MTRPKQRQRQRQQQRQQTTTTTTTTTTDRRASPPFGEGRPTPPRTPESVKNDTAANVPTCRVAPRSPNVGSWAGEEQAGQEAAAEVLMVLSQNKVLQRFVEQIVDDLCWAWTGFNSASRSRTSSAPRLSRAVWRGSSGAVLRREHVAHAVSFGNLDIISTSSLSGRHLLSCDSLRKFSKNSLSCST